MDDSNEMDIEKDGEGVCDLDAESSFESVKVAERVEVSKSVGVSVALNVSDCVRDKVDERLSVAVAESEKDMLYVSVPDLEKLGSEVNDMEALKLNVDDVLRDPDSSCVRLAEIVMEGESDVVTVSEVVNDGVVVIDPSRDLVVVKLGSFEGDLVKLPSLVNVLELVCSSEGLRVLGGVMVCVGSPDMDTDGVEELLFEAASVGSLDSEISELEKEGLWVVSEESVMVGVGEFDNVFVGSSESLPVTSGEDDADCIDEGVHV